MDSLSDIITLNVQPRWEWVLTVRVILIRQVGCFFSGEESEEDPDEAFLMDDWAGKAPGESKGSLLVFLLLDLIFVFLVIFLVVNLNIKGVFGSWIMKKLEWIIPLTKFQIVCLVHIIKVMESFEFHNLRNSSFIGLSEANWVPTNQTCGQIPF